MNLERRRRGGRPWKDSDRHLRRNPEELSPKRWGRCPRGASTCPSRRWWCPPRRRRASSASSSLTPTCSPLSCPPGKCHRTLARWLYRWALAVDLYKLCKCCKLCKLTRSFEYSSSDLEIFKFVRVYLI